MSGFNELGGFIQEALERGRREAAYAATDTSLRGMIIGMVRRDWPMREATHGRGAGVPPVRDGGNTAALIDLAVDTTLRIAMNAVPAPAPTSSISDPVYRIARRATPTVKFGACSDDDVVYRSRGAAEARLAKILELQASLVRCFPLTYAAAEYRIEQAEPAWEAA